VKIVLNVVGVLFIIPGLTFFLQGINVLPGSFMTGDPRWAVNGAVLILIGVALIVFANWRRGGMKKGG